MHVEENLVPADGRVALGWIVFGGFFAFAVHADLVSLAFPFAVAVAGVGALAGAAGEIGMHRTAVGRRVRRAFVALTVPRKLALATATSVATWTLPTDTWLSTYGGAPLLALFALFGGALVVQTVHLFEVA